MNIWQALVFATWLVVASASLLWLLRRRNLPILLMLLASLAVAVAIVLNAMAEVVIVAEFNRDGRIPQIDGLPMRMKVGVFGQLGFAVGFMWEILLQHRQAAATERRSRDASQ